MGFAISSGLVPCLADKYGRKWPYFFSLLVQTGAYVGIFFSKSISLTIGLYLVVGLCAGGRVAIGTTYMNEFLPERRQNLCTTLLNVHDASIMLWQAIYYKVKPDWVPLHIYGMGFAVFILIAIQFIPESPKFYFSQGRFDEARKVLAFVARRNGADDKVFDHVVFEGEQQEDKEDGLNLTRPSMSPNVNNNEDTIRIEGKLSEIFTIW